MPERRSSLTVRVLQFMLLLALLSPLPALIVTLSLVDPSTSNGIATTFGPLVVISMIAAIMLARRMFSPGWGSPPGPSDGDDGGGWVRGGRPRRPIPRAAASRCRMLSSRASGSATTIAPRDAGCAAGRPRARSRAGADRATPLAVDALVAPSAKAVRVAKIAVTGGSGKAGRVVVQDLFERGHEVLNIDRAPSPQSSSRNRRSRSCGRT